MGKIILALITVSLLATGCAMHRRTSFVKHHPGLSPVVKNNIKQGYITKGMTKQQVRASWGYPCWYCYGTIHSTWGDVWEYNIFGSSAMGAGDSTFVYFNSAGHVIGWSR